ncbi:MAG: GNAT family N-acetyltransferase [Acidimicrobiales bacterium]
MRTDEIVTMDPRVHRNGGTPPLIGHETLFDSDPWREALEASFDLDIRTFIPASEPEGRAQYCLISDIRGSRVVCLPFSDFCQPRLGEHGWNEYLAHLQSYGRPVTIRPFKVDNLTGNPSFERRDDHIWHGIDLSDGYDAFWTGLKSKVRTVVRRKARYGVSFRWTNSIDDLARFHAMHVDLRKSKYRLLAQPFEFFANLHDLFGDSLALVMAEVDGEPVAGMVYLECGGTWNYKFGASYPRTYRPNAALVVEACREGADRGLDLLDLGRSDIAQDGLIRFKRQFASSERMLTTLHWSPPGVETDESRAASDTLTSLTSLLTAPGVPNDVSAEGGALLYKYFG